MSCMVRINTRISKTLNDWLDKRSKETGVPKSTLVFFAIEQYMQQQKTLDIVGGLTSSLKQRSEAE